MSNLTDRLLSWAHNEEMIDTHYTAHGTDCIRAAKELERLHELLAITMSWHRQFPVQEFLEDGNTTT